MTFMPHDIDPIDREIIERALQDVLIVLKGKTSGLVTDEQLEKKLRGELTQIARVEGLTDAETLRDVLLEALSDDRVSALTPSA